MTKTTKKKKPADSNAKTVKKTASAGKKAQKTARKAQTHMRKTSVETAEKAKQFTQETMEMTMNQTTKNFEKYTSEANEISRDGFEAMIKSGTIFAKGFEELMRTATTLAQTSAEKQAQYMKEAMSSKTLNEWATAQNKIAQASFDDFMSGATKLSEMGIKVLTETTEPLNEQMNKGIKKATDAMAA